MENEHKHHIVPYKTYLVILAILISLTFLSVAVTSIELGVLTVTTALVIAAIKGSLVLRYFMHLKFDQRIYGIMATGVILLIFVVIFVTFLDYLYR